MSREFDCHQQAWRDHAAPWARIRYAVVRHVLRALDELGPGPHLVLTH